MPGTDGDHSTRPGEDQIGGGAAGGGAGSAEAGASGRVTWAAYRNGDSWTDCCCKTVPGSLIHSDD